MTAASAPSEARTLPGMLARRARATPAAAAYCVRQRDAWEPVGWADFERGTLAVARALAARGVGRGDRVGILGRTSIAWEYLQMGALRLGAVAVGIDTSYPDPTLHALLRDLQLHALGVNDAAMLARVPADVRRALKVVAYFEAPAPAEPPALYLSRTVSADDLSQGVELPPPPGRYDPAITVYSSGTTGAPRPITYTHEQVALAVGAITPLFPDIGPHSRFACWLPLANLFQRIIDFCAIELGATSYFVSEPRALVAELPGISPVILIGVPRFYERLQAGIAARVEAATGWRGAVGRWALALARQRASGAATLLDRWSAPLADALVYARIRSTLGSSLLYLVSGSAPMARGLLEWYDALGLPLYEAYGVSENIVPIAMNRPGARRLGSVGQPLPPNEVRIAEDGEILVRGPGLHLEAARTAQADAGGYWHTGDLGRFDADGFLSVTGRKTDLFKSAGGRWIVPQHVEAALRALPYLEDVVALGAGRPAVVAVASLDWDALRTRAARRGIEACLPDRRELTAQGRRLLSDDAAGAVGTLAAHERPGALIVVEAFSIESGELTTNLKLRRQAIEARVRPQLDAAYAAIAARQLGASGPVQGPLVFPGP